MSTRLIYGLGVINDVTNLFGLNTYMDMQLMIKRIEMTPSADTLTPFMDLVASLMLYTTSNSNPITNH